MSKVSCIMPAYNEATRIGAVLSVAAAHPLIDEVIVVDDGSSDGTGAVARAYERVTVLVHEKNAGKSRAIHTGIMRSTGDVLLFLDTDLAGLKEKDISDLLEPVLSKRAVVSISRRRINLFFDFLYHFTRIDIFSGERAFPRELIKGREDELQSLSNFGIETFLNKIIIAKRCTIAVVYWKHVATPLKAAKFGFFEGLARDFSMAADILKTAPLSEIIRQFHSLRALMIR